MLEVLHSIVQEVNAASDLGEALGIIVRRVKQAIRADVCSVYLTDFDTREHVLLATDGLNPEAVGQVRLPLHRGLIGLVSERAEPINLDDAPSHPRYMFITETGEKHFHGFLGVPIIQNRRVLGVVVVRQQEPRRFDDNEVTFLFTLAAQLAGAITHAQASGELATIQDHSAPSRFLQGRPGASGVAIGTLVVVYPEANLSAVPDRGAEDPQTEEAAFCTAVKAVESDLKTLQGRMGATLDAEDRALFDAWLLMLGSDTLVERTVERIRNGSWAPGALRQTIDEHAQVFDRMEDVYLRERASDVRDLGRRILMHLQRETPRPTEYAEDTILAGEDVSAVQLAEVPEGRLAGVVSARGTSSSHVAILARAMGVPAVMGVSDLPVGRLEGRQAILDGYRGRVYITPTPSVVAEYERLAEDERALSAELEALRGLPTETLDGTPIPLYLNTGLVSEMGVLGTDEAAGVGLYRTELPFMVRDRFPGEAVQMMNYRRVLKAFDPRPVVMRTLDIGGDKPLPYFPMQESNPFLGWRGIRVSLDHPEIFLTQLRAMLRAAVGVGNLRIMLPMITNVSEVDEALSLIQRAHDELQEEGYAVTMPRIGVMVEVPSAVYQVEALARRVDFLSIGTNDLTQYLLAVDRNNAKVADLYEELHPAVLRSLVQVVEGARMYSRDVGVCGEMAGSPMAVVLLLGMGITSLSMSGGSLLRTKRVVRSFSTSRARQLLRTALRFEDAASVRQLMENALEDVGLGGLVRPGK
ncbi:MAG: phosphoenolpyruvate--protein phosphotransferase [Chromatiales bacterium]|jgi:phosphotransferase system enzyme I (PtsP)